MSDPLAIARAFVTARRAARPLPAFPGELPGDLDAAYAVQEASLSLAPGRLSGWKVAGIPDAFRPRYAAERLVGPINDGGVETLADGGVATVAVYVGGFAAVEAEFVVRLREDAPCRALTEAEIAALSTLHVGSEIASSPLAVINQLGPGAVISDHGNNAGAILGPQIDPIPFDAWKKLVSRTYVDGVLVGEGTAARVAGGPFVSAAFLTRALAGRGRHLKAGDIVLTGMTTGIHDIRPGEQARLEFPGIGSFTLNVAARRAVEEELDAAI